MEEDRIVESGVLGREGKIMFLRKVASSRNGNRSREG